MKNKNIIKNICIYVSVPVITFLFHIIGSALAENSHVYMIALVFLFSPYWLPSVLSGIITHYNTKNVSIFINGAILILLIPVTCLLTFSFMYKPYDLSGNENLRNLFVFRTVLSSIIGIVFTLLFNLWAYIKKKTESLKKSFTVNLILTVLGAIVCLSFCTLPAIFDVNHREADDIFFLSMLLAVFMPFIGSVIVGKTVAFYDGRLSSEIICMVVWALMVFVSYGIVGVYFEGWHFSQAWLVTDAVLLVLNVIVMYAMIFFSELKKT